jgi:hypothetical protein
MSSWVRAAIGVLVTAGIAAGSALPASAAPLQFRTVDVPGAAGTEVFGIDHEGVLPGDYNDQNGNTYGFIRANR